MKILYLDCGMGAAGDMLTAALLELFPNQEEIVQELNALGIPKVVFTRESVAKCGITGTHVTVTVDGQEESEEMHEHHHEHAHEHDHEHEHAHEHAHEHEHEHHHHHEHAHHHSSLHDIEHIVNEHVNLPEAVKRDVLSVYKLIAEAESRVHGKPVTEIHFHEVGTMDALADITAVCYLMHKLSPDQVVASPIHVGSGTVKCAHGILPVPAPATASILRGIPIYGGEIKGELCTPTGAALLKHFASRFGEMPVMTVDSIGYGMGKKDFPVANCVRAMLGEAKGQDESILQLSCNVDDMTAEEIGYAMDCLFKEGALEVFTVPVGMKKCRPGILINVLCRPADREKMVQAIFKYSSTIGIREETMRRYTLQRSISAVDTPFGQVRRKVSSGYGVRTVKYEYEDLARIASERNISIGAVKELLNKLEQTE